MEALVGMSSEANGVETSPRRRFRLRSPGGRRSTAPANMGRGEKERKRLEKREIHSSSSSIIEEQQYAMATGNRLRDRKAID